MLAAGKCYPFNLQKMFKDADSAYTNITTSLPFFQNRAKIAMWDVFCYLIQHLRVLGEKHVSNPCYP